MNYLRFYRLQANMSQMALSAATKIPQPTISHYENGLRLKYAHARMFALTLGKVLGFNINPLMLDETVGYLGQQNDQQTDNDTTENSQE